MALATRSGVLTRPSRSGSSPSRVSWSCTSAAYAVVGPSSASWSDGWRAGLSGATIATLLTGVLDIVVGRLPEHQPDEPPRADGRRELAPDGDDDVFRRRDHVAHELHVEIEVLVVDLVDDTLLDEALEDREVHHVPGALTDRAADADVQRIVVPVPVRVV